MTCNEGNVRMKIFITGSNGQLGQDCLRVFEGDHDARGMDLPDLDITVPEQIAASLGSFHPDVIINCAAYTQVDKAESDRDAARRVNADGPRLLAEFVERQGGHLIHISTDYVFDGRRAPPQPYVETDEPGPTCMYGMTKLEGERAVQQTTRRHTIVRTAWLYGAGGPNFLKTMLRAALRKPGETIRVVNDQHGSPTWSYRLALQMSKLVDCGSQGLYHATAEGHCTWYELARAFLGRMGLEHRLVPCATDEYPTPARRPRNSILENARLKAAGLNVMVDWESDMAEFVRTHREAWLREMGAA
jgi:dTDP-4-dehydrorhamnose reductase